MTLRTDPLRRALLAGLAALPLVQPAARAAEPPGPLVEVWKDPNCGCCNDWIAHLQAHGLRVRAHDTGNAAMRQRLGLPAHYASCHTARAGGYVIEGHVPAPDILRLLRERPQALGLAVPGMPVGSPGMDGPEYGGRRDPYDVLLVQRDGASRVWARYPGGGLRPVQAHGHELHGGGATATSGWVDGEVRRIDAAARKVTLRHGDIPGLDMPAMTMVFQVHDAALLQGLQPGQRVRFRAARMNGAYVVTEIKPGP